MRFAASLMPRSLSTSLDDALCAIFRANDCRFCRLSPDYITSLGRLPASPLNGPPLQAAGLMPRVLAGGAASSSVLALPPIADVGYIC